MPIIWLRSVESSPGTLSRLDIIELAYLTPLYPSNQNQSILLVLRSLLLEVGVIIAFRSCAGPDLSVVPITATSEKIRSVSRGAPSPAHTYLRFLLQLVIAASNPSLEVNVTDGS